MSPETFQWIKAAHVVGFLVWTGGLLSCVHLLRVHASIAAESYQIMSGVERKVAMVMDMGALVAIVSGLYLALGGVLNAFTNGGWLHMKLAVVVLGLLGLHGYIRVKIRKFRNGQVAALPAFVYPATLAVIVIIAIIAAVKPTAKF